MPGATLVPRRAAQLRRAPGRRRRGRRHGRDHLPLADARVVRAHVRRVPRAGRACARGTPAARRGAGRSRRRVHAEHPRDGRRVRRDREPRRGLGQLRSRARRAQRHRPPRSARADGARSRSAATATATARSTAATRSRRSARRCPRCGTWWTCPYGEHRLADALLVGRAAGRAGAARVRAGRVRPSALRALLVRHDRPAQGHRARARRHPAGVLQGALLQLGSQARRAPAVVHDDVVDDVERARRGARRALVDRDARRRPGVARPRLAVAASQSRRGRRSWASARRS